MIEYLLILPLSSWFELEQFKCYNSCFIAVPTRFIFTAQGLKHDHHSALLARLCCEKVSCSLFVRCSSGCSYRVVWRKCRNRFCVCFTTTQGRRAIPNSKLSSFRFTPRLTHQNSERFVESLSIAFCFVSFDHLFVFVLFRFDH